MTRIAFIGLGVMGRPMSINLVRAGHTVVGFNRTPSRAADLVRAGGRAADSIADAVSGADVVMLNVPDSPDVESMKFVWGESSAEQRAQTLSDLGLEAGGAVTDEAVASFAQQANEVGIILDDAEAREFLEWAVQQP